MSTTLTGYKTYSAEALKQALQKALAEQSEIKIEAEKINPLFNGAKTVGAISQGGGDYYIVFDKGDRQTILDWKSGKVFDRRMNGNGLPDTVSRPVCNAGDSDAEQNCQSASFVLADVLLGVFIRQQDEPEEIKNGPALKLIRSVEAYFYDGNLSPDYQMFREIILDAR